MKSGKSHPIPQLELKSFRSLSASLRDAPPRRIYRFCWTLSGVIMKRNLQRMVEVGDNLTAAEMRDAMISLFEVGSEGVSDIAIAPVPYFDGFTLDVSDREAIKRSMRLASGRLMGALNREYRELWVQQREERPVGRRETSTIEIDGPIYRAYRPKAWRMLLGAWRAGRSLRELDGAATCLPTPKGQIDGPARRLAAPARKIGRA